MPFVKDAYTLSVHWILNLRLVFLYSVLLLLGLQLDRPPMRIADDSLDLRLVRSSSIAVLECVVSDISKDKAAQNDALRFVLW